MTVMVAEVDGALLEVGAPADTARKAAEAHAQSDQRFATIDTDLAVLKYMVGFTLAGVVGVAARLITQ